MYEYICDYCHSEIDDTDGNWGWIEFGGAFHTECIQQYEDISLEGGNRIDDRY